MLCWPIFSVIRYLANLPFSSSPVSFGISTGGRRNRFVWLAQRRRRRP
jgi:hypothetical protein